MWHLRVWRCAKHFWQTSHWNGFSLVWVIMCVFRLPRREKHFWQISHWKGFSVVWVLVCLVMSVHFEKYFWQFSHWYSLFMPWVIRWLPRWFWLRCTGASMFDETLMYRLPICSDCLQSIPNCWVLKYFFRCWRTCLLFVSRESCQMPQCVHKKGFKIPMLCSLLKICNYKVVKYELRQGLSNPRIGRSTWILPKHSEFWGVCNNDNHVKISRRVGFRMSGINESHRGCSSLYSKKVVYKTTCRRTQVVGVFRPLKKSKKRQWIKLLYPRVMVMLRGVILL